MNDSVDLPCHFIQDGPFSINRDFHSGTCTARHHCKNVKNDMIDETMIAVISVTAPPFLPLLISNAVRRNRSQRRISPILQNRISVWEWKWNHFNIWKYEEWFSRISWSFLITPRANQGEIIERYFQVIQVFHLAITHKNLNKKLRYCHHTRQNEHFLATLHILLNPILK